VIWATLALLGIPIWLIAIVLIAAFRNRNKVLSNPDIFAYKLKAGDGWQRKKGYARWVSDVLIYHAGTALIRTDAFQIGTTRVHGETVPPVKGLGEDPVSIEVTYANGKTATIAVTAQELYVAIGPDKDPRTSPQPASRTTLFGSA
jgi:hypothetical protein